MIITINDNELHKLTKSDWLFGKIDTSKTFPVFWDDWTDLDDRRVRIMQNRASSIKMLCDGIKGMIRK